jgi:cold shock protein
MTVFHSTEPTVPQARTNGGKDVFIHISAVERAGLSTLAEGQNVTFDLVVNRGREAAENLKLAR